MEKRDNLSVSSDDDPLSSPQTPGPGGTNPFSEGRKGTTGGTGGVNPSAPTIGTEAWGLAPNEAKTTGSGQGRLGSESPENNLDVEQNHDRRPTFTSERDEQPIGERTFRCADVGNSDCRWETTARTDDDLMSQVERHGREVHGIESFDDATRRKYINAIRERRAA
jgi:predicted small metal-binding protein